MTKFKKIALASLAGLGLVAAVGGAAHAGIKYAPSAVYIYPTSASGYMGTARNSADLRQMIGCQIYVIGSPASSTVNCWATDANNVSASCTSTKSAFLAAVEATTPNSYVTFAWNTSGQCTVVTTDNESGNPVMVP